MVQQDVFLCEINVRENFIASVSVSFTREKMKTSEWI